VAARDSYGRLLALLAAATSDLAGAEDALADAFERALRTWPSQGVPASPDAWLLTVARNRLRDEWKSARVQRAVPLDAAPDTLAHIDDVDVDAIPDRRLELMLVCAHPAIDRAMHTPLMLNTVLGFTAEQVGRAFSVPAPTMATRLVRVKKRIKAAGIPFRIPDLADLPARMASVLEAVYGAYVIDWATGPQARQLPSEALHLAEVLTTLVPGDPEPGGPGAPRTGRRCSPCTASCRRSRPPSAAASPSPPSPPRSTGPPRGWPHSTRCSWKPASAPGSSSRPGPPARTCWTSSGGKKRPSRPMRARSA
jgi:RNA polymerase sigma-70 factor (ECF subfamily)